MRSDNAVSTAARDKAEQDAAFSQSMANKFHLDAPTGILTLRTLDDLSARTDELLALVSKLEQRIEKLEKVLAKQK